MKQLLAIFFLLISAISVGQKIPSKPNPPRLVNDFVGLLEPNQVRRLEEKLVAYDDTTSIQIAVVIVPTLNDYEPAEYATKLGREWGIGNKKTNNGVILLISTEEGRRKTFITPGYGLEGSLPDIVCNQIVEGELIPQLKKGNYYEGIDAATEAIIKASMGEYKAPKDYRKKGKGGGSGMVFVIILIVVIFLVGAGRGGGGPKGGMFSRRGYHDFMGPMIWFPGGGGRGSSGGGGWSGGGGGGFGGFGGGSFGGGGAGGSW